jgi:uncharacterized protein YjbJ (UPF0337 family)
MRASAKRQEKILRALTLGFAGGLALIAVSGCDKSSGGGQKTAGRIESGVGSMTGDDHLKREGKKDEVVGGVKSAVGDLKGAAKDATH